VLGAAEAAADFAGILYTDAPANGEADSVGHWITSNWSATCSLPCRADGRWGNSTRNSRRDLRRVQTRDFKRDCPLFEYAYNIAAGNSSGYNYASGRLDHQTYFKSIRVDQSFTASAVLDRIFRAWLREYRLAKVIEIDQLEIPHTWFWDGVEHVDPQKEATAQETRLRNRTTTLPQNTQNRAKDWETSFTRLPKKKP
jgi:hypothetical protein